MSDKNLWLIVGLGNPGINYSKNRHNIGYMVLDRIAKSNNVVFNKKAKFSALICDSKELYTNKSNIILVKSLEYMNTLGKSISQVVNFYKIHHEKIIVVHDELDLKFGALKITKSKSDGGHNGIKDLNKSFGFDNYIRLRLGIGRPKNQLIHKYVLQNFYPDQQEILDQLIQNACKAIIDLTSIGIINAQNIYNTKNKE